MSNDVFISYSHDDKEWLDRLQKTLKPLLRNKTITSWDDTKIRVGAKWKDDIEKALTEAKAAVLLVSQNFLASDFIASEEVPELLKSASTKGLKIIWVPISDCLWQETEIANYQAAYSPESPLDSLETWQVNRALVEICRKIKEALRPPPEPQPEPEPEPPPDNGKKKKSQEWASPPPLPPSSFAQFAGTWRNPDGSYAIIRQSGALVAAESFIDIFGVANRVAWGQGTIVGRQAFFDFADIQNNAGRLTVTLAEDGQSIFGVARYHTGMVQNIFATRVA
jgi:TIR domain-containing protein